MPFDTDHRDITARKETLNQYPRREIFQESHQQPTSFLYQPTIECIVQQMHGIKLSSICQAYAGVIVTICPSDTPHPPPAQAPSLAPTPRLTARVNPTIHGTMLRIARGVGWWSVYSRVDPCGQPWGGGGGRLTRFACFE